MAQDAAAFIDPWHPGSMDDDDLGMSAGKYARLDGGDDLNENKERYARENHSEIERRRRNKMTHYINELAEMVPQCAALGRKPDKLTILRMAVSHMKAIRGHNSQDESGYKPSFLSDQELKHLILEAANGFLFVVCCNTGRVLYVADSITPVLNLKQEDWINHTINELIHPDDQDKIRDQLCGSEVAINKVLDLKTGTVKREGAASRVHMTCRRGFICRMRLGPLEPLHRLRNRRPLFQHGGHNYVVMHCTGYIKNTPPTGIDAPPSSCLVAIARLQVASMPLYKGPVTAIQLRIRIAGQKKINISTQKIASFISLSSNEILYDYGRNLKHDINDQTLHDPSMQELHFVAEIRKVSFRVKSQRLYVTHAVAILRFPNKSSEKLEYSFQTKLVVLRSGNPWDFPRQFPSTCTQPFSPHRTYKATSRTSSMNFAFFSSLVFSSSTLRFSLRCNSKFVLIFN
ncbi:unnamed protein product [Cylicocyclus nassatus]|uniref:Aryl hydrocarbon receptor nuclear translocator homolog n=1 Tax=Cylicocyclus nassatus TaxID=53992 RepID=A0AA36DX32_CYLNA|nr:unnamed protein product [Cylicocyclus nassatus]